MAIYNPTDDELDVLRQVNAGLSRRFGGKRSNYLLDDDRDRLSPVVSVWVTHHKTRQVVYLASGPTLREACIALRDQIHKDNLGRAQKGNAA